MKKSIAIPIILLCLLYCGGKQEKVGISDLDFTLSSIDGEKISLSDYKGKVVIVDFWATWCPPCRRSIPHLVGLYERYKERGLVILGISSEDIETLKAFREENNIRYPLLIGTKEVFRKYNVQGIPHTVFIDRQGRQRKIQVGFVDALVPMFEALIDTLINE